MSKMKRIIEFILALLNFLFHFKPSADEESPLIPEAYPRPAAPPGQEGPVGVFETVC